MAPAKIEIQPSMECSVKDSSWLRPCHDIKSYWTNAFKSDTYSVFAIQFKSQDSTTKQDAVTTHMVTVSCLADGSPFIDADIGWSVPLDSLHKID